jgi:hypothetical protein
MGKDSETGFGRHLKLQMFALSFSALFLEMMVIRWVPSVVHFVAYYANLMLLSSFLGLGIGAMTSDRNWRLFRWFPAALGCEVTLLLLCRDASLSSSLSEVRFFTAIGQSGLNIILLVLLFSSNALLFVPLGERMGQLFSALPRLSAYAWDLAGSLSGTLVFGLFSLTYFSPISGIAVVMVLYLLLSSRRRWILDLPVFCAVLVLMFASGERGEIWSPYYHITVSQLGGADFPETTPPPDLRTMRNPPLYHVKVNQFGYHFDGTLDTARYIKGSDLEYYVNSLAHQYLLPYSLCPGRDRALIFGSGGGLDTQAALMAGVRHVDAVEVDPVIEQLSNKFNSAAPYLDPRVQVYIDDARSFEAKAKPGYDLVVFGYLDSQALFSSMNNARLDGYVYTVESIRSAFSLLNDHGMLTLSFFVPRKWLEYKLVAMVKEATGREPCVYVEPQKWGAVIGVSKDPAVVYPMRKAQFARVDPSLNPPVDVPTDDWPFLYLQKRSIPSDYMIAIGSMLALSLVATAGLRRSSVTKSDFHFLLLGLGFLLLETKSISDCTLYFGATWVVTTVVVAGVLLMVMAANLVATRLRAFSFWMYLPLFLTLALLFPVPREQILVYSFPVRLCWALVAVPLPVFFAGIIFSTTFRESIAPAEAFGANLIGAMIGGFLEYLTMAIGNHHLSLMILVAYLGSLGVLHYERRPTSG